MLIAFLSTEIEKKNCSPAKCTKCFDIGASISVLKSKQYNINECISMQYMGRIA